MAVITLSLFGNQPELANVMSFYWVKFQSKAVKPQSCTLPLQCNTYPIFHHGRFWKLTRSSTSRGQNLNLPPQINDFFVIGCYQQLVLFIPLMIYIKNLLNNNRTQFDSRSLSLNSSKQTNKFSDVFIIVVVLKKK